MGEAAEVLPEEDEWDDTWHAGGEEFDDNPWMPERPLREDPILVRQSQKRLPKALAVKPSQFVSKVFYMPNETGKGQAFEPFSFKGREHLYRPYDSPARKILLMCGRQVEKSTLLGNITLCYMCLVTAMRALYVSPSATQAKTFSNDRVKEPIETSPILKRFTTKMLSQNILEKQFVNRSKITLRYAYLNADRARGIPAWMLLMDEIQDILKDNIPVIEHCLSHAPVNRKRQVYAGTPKSLDNVIEDYRANQSTQGEWVVPCDGCNHWNVLGEKNIGLKGPICEKCGKGINPQSEKAQWAWMVKPDPERLKVPWESYRIPQLMVPWKIQSWNEVLYDYEHHPRSRFYNECLGISFESGLRPITSAQIRDVCVDKSVYSMSKLEEIRPLSLAQPFFAGIDWGTGDNAYTVLTLATYVEMKFRVLFMHRFVGEESDPEVQIARIKEICHRFNVAKIGVDHGFGFGLNSRLIREFGRQRVHEFQYMARIGGKVQFDNQQLRWKLHRTAVMSAIFDAVKAGKCEFPPWDEFKDPHARDFLNIYSEYNEKLRMIQYDHVPGNPDDSFHSLVYCWLASMLVVARPDILIPNQEDPETGKPISSYKGPLYQG